MWFNNALYQLVIRSPCPISDIRHEFVLDSIVADVGHTASHVSLIFENLSLKSPLQKRSTRKFFSVFGLRIHGVGEFQLVHEFGKRPVLKLRS
jgi:hypothetical protein